MLTCLVSGSTNKQIARRLDMTPVQVNVFMKSILRKLGVVNRTQAAMWAWRNTETIHNGFMNGHYFNPE